MKVLICDATDPKALETIAEAGIEVVNRPDITPEELEEAIPEYDCMVVRSRTKVRVPVIDKAAKLKAIVRGGVGLDNIDVEYAKSKGIQVLNTPSASTQAVAELATGYLLALARHIPQMTASMKAGKWEKKAFSGIEVSGKTLGVVGAGRIGQGVAKRAHALGMTILAYDPFVSEGENIEFVSLDELFKRSDFITLHVPHIKATHNIVDAKSIEMMKDGVYIINCGRGGTIDEDALYEAIKAGKVAGAALDVYAEEPSKGHKLYTLDEVIGSPHIGAGTAEAKARVGEEVAQNVIGALS
ncbi:MAG: 3-phosphoglycerate dehydrogenase [Anaerolinea sp. 4484_236]|nr:MAG: 3-phosphoglycerate dehydrogenase [Anaerolinea sp. 4484_236]OQY36886.1 MAG: 3-phosphoglycerate dehydrogenase [Anaerolineaceae bacterium 4572_5.2]RLD11021.1 MAG: 3-phosphoglycerate dehydrogenase [Chloroflexota bacterium]